MFDVNVQLSYVMYFLDLKDMKFYQTVMKFLYNNYKHRYWLLIMQKIH